MVMLVDGDERQGGNLPWVEKYRPKSLDEVEHQDGVVKALKQSLQTNNLPHLLFYGPPGTGKTSTILAVARQLYGPELMKKRVKELNASDERGINVIRTKVKDFAQIAIGNDKANGFPCPPYKIIILDECDSMTQDAQSALRRVMENYSKVTRFCLICNYVTRIIDPIASRCAKFRFKPLNPESITRRIRHICSTEGIVAHDDAIDTVLSISNGDMRNAINVMQSARLLHLEGDPVTVDTIREVAGFIPDEVVQSLLASTATSCDVAAIEVAVQEVVANGYPAGRMIEQLLGAVENQVDLTDAMKAHICLKIADVDQGLVDGADEYLQLLSLLAFIHRVRARRY
ncbi:AAA+ ATPase domain-containing protein [Plasmodiophora brassicae]|uniref:Replication factor C subunit 2 n=1 Tax=Plasmodiophora brassicae TaxID=37360 RepID=A0A3P3YBC7_PLABS|nr:unnamed protein product [Plasmodiophora brassicae]